MFRPHDPAGIRPEADHPSRWRTELPAIARHAATVLTGQLAVMAFGVTDTVIAGRHSEGALAALSVGSAIFISVYVSLMGVMQALLPVWAEQHGAGRPLEIGRSVRQALYLWIGASAAGISLLLAPAPLLRWTEVPTALQPQVTAYLAILGAALPAALLFRLFGTLNQGIGHPRLVTWLQVASLGLKVPLSAWWALGGAGLEPQGAVGCAWATFTVNYVLLGAAVVMLRTQAVYRPYRLWRRPERPDSRALAGFLRLGIPAGLAILVEVTSFTLMALFIARQGTVPAAAHQIAASVAATLYMVPLSIAIATSARVGYWLGGGNPSRARDAVWMGLAASALMALTLAAILLIARPWLAGWFARSGAVAAMGAGLLGWVALYHLADGLQCVSVFVLRSYRVTVLPLVVYGALLWGIGLGGGYLWAYRGGIAGLALRPQPSTFWIAATLALAITAAAFVWLVRRTTLKGLSAPHSRGPAPAWLV